MEDERRRQVGLFRYALIRPALDDRLSPAERGQLVRALAAGEHPGPQGRPVRVARSTIYRWMKDYRDGGFDALVPKPRSSQPVSDVELLDLAVRLKRENPKRTATHICELVTAELAAGGDGRVVPSARTIQRHFARLGLNKPPAPGARKVRGRFEAAARNDRWIGDGMHGPTIGTRRAILVAFLDDHSRLVVGHHWGWAEDVVRLEAALRRGLAARGIPDQVYVDNGSAFISQPLHRACAVLGIRVSHSTPGEPQGRGKIERFFRTVREQFLVEVDHRGVDGLDELRRLFVAWLERRYHRRVHSETGQAPLERFVADGIPDVPGPDLLREAFLWSATRTVTKTSTISFLGNRYEVDPALVGQKIELVYDPFDLARIEIRWHGSSFGVATPHELTADVHPNVAGRHDHDEPQPATGIDYLALIAAEHRQATAKSITYADLTPDRHDDEQDL